MRQVGVGEDVAYLLSWYYAWGGAVPALGGALIIGACPRIWRYPGFRSALPAAVGFAILGVSRPFDAIMLSVPLGVALAVWLHGLKPVPMGVLRAGAALVSVGGAAITSENL